MRRLISLTLTLGLACLLAACAIDSREYGVGLLEKASSVLSRIIREVGLRLAAREDAGFDIGGTPMYASVDPALVPVAGYRFHDNDGHTGEFAIPAYASVTVFFEGRGTTSLSTRKGIGTYDTRVQLYREVLREALLRPEFSANSAELDKVTSLFNGALEETIDGSESVRVTASALGTIASGIPQVAGTSKSLLQVAEGLGDFQDALGDTNLELALDVRDLLIKTVVYNAEVVVRQQAFEAFLITRNAAGSLDPAIIKAYCGSEVITPCNGTGGVKGDIFDIVGVENDRYRSGDHNIIRQIIIQGGQSPDKIAWGFIVDHGADVASWLCGSTPGCGLLSFLTGVTLEAMRDTALQGEFIQQLGCIATLNRTLFDDQFIDVRTMEIRSPAWDDGIEVLAMQLYLNYLYASLTRRLVDFDEGSALLKYVNVYIRGEGNIKAVSDAADQMQRYAEYWYKRAMYLKKGIPVAKETIVKFGLSSYVARAGRPVIFDATSTIDDSSPTDVFHPEAQKGFFVWSGGPGGTVPLSDRYRVVFPNTQSAWNITLEFFPSDGRPKASKTMQVQVLPAVSKIHRSVGGSVDAAWVAWPPDVNTNPPAYSRDPGACVTIEVRADYDGLIPAEDITDQIEWMSSNPEALEYIPATNCLRSTAGGPMQIFGTWEQQPVVALKINSRFADVPNGVWFSESVNGLADLGAITGKPDGLFHPSDVVTRAEFLKMLVNIAELVPGRGWKKHYTETTPPFSDIPANEWYYKPVMVALANNILDRTKPTFRPGDPLLRAEAAKLLCLVFNYSTPSVDVSKFSDVATTDWFSPYVHAAQAHGAITGYLKVSDPPPFLPQNNINRAEAAAMIWRALQDSNPNAVVGGQP